MCVGGRLRDDGFSQLAYPHLGTVLQITHLHFGGLTGRERGRMGTGDVCEEGEERRERERNDGTLSITKDQDLQSDQFMS